MPGLLYGGGRLAAPEVPEYLPRRVVARCSGDAAAGVRARGAEVETFHRRAVVGVAEHGPRREELVERQRAVEDVPADHAEVALVVERREDFSREDARLEVRCVAVDGFDDGVCGGFSYIVPAASPGQHRVEMLAEEARDMFSRRRETGVDGARNQHLDDGLARVALRASVEVGALHVRER